LCPIDPESFLYTSYWCRNKLLEEQTISDGLESSLEQLCLHEQSMWDEYAPQFRKIMHERGQLPRGPLDRQCYLEIMRERGNDRY
jgi:hypothetical protein